MKMNSFLTSVFFMFTLYISAQTGSITGNVSDSTTKETIPGVKVMLEGQAKGAFTDLDGKYVINPQYDYLEIDGDRIMCNQNNKLGWIVGVQMAPY